MNNNLTASNNVYVFLDAIKDIIGDWINMHGHYPIDRDKISIIFMDFVTEVEGTINAKYLDDKFGKYCFEVDMLQGKILLSVIDDTNDALVTKKWNGSSYLSFDKKGYSYELSTQEYYYLNRAKDPALKLFYSEGA